MADAKLASLTATEAAAEIARGAVSAEDYTAACLDRIAAIENDVQAFAHLDREHALAQARALDERKARASRSARCMVFRSAIKDIFDTADYPTECGSPVLAGRRPLHDATVIAQAARAPAPSSSARR